MAAFPAYRFNVEPVDRGQVGSVDTIKRGSAKSEGTPHAIIIIPTSAQIQGVYNYLALIKAGVDTSTVETAITALTP